MSITFLPKEMLSYCICVLLDLPCSTIIYDLVILYFDLLLKNLNLRHNFLTIRDKAFILNMFIAFDKAFRMIHVP